MPAKPPNIIVERWLPYKQQKRQVIYEKALSTNDNVTSTTDQQTQNNLIIQYANPSVRIEKQMRSLGVVRCDPFEQNKNSNLSSPKNIGTNISLNLFFSLFYYSYSYRTYLP
jgi:hypothetical protein